MQAILETRYLSPQEAAAYLRCSKSFLDKDRCSKLHNIPFIRLGRRVLYDSQALDRWMAARASDSSAQ